MTSVQSASYWSATMYAFSPAAAWLVGFDNGFVSSTSKTPSLFRVWCVRGGMNAADQY